MRLNSLIKNWKYHLIFFIIGLIGFISIYMVVDKYKLLPAWLFVLTFGTFLYISRYYLLRKYWRNDGRD